MIAVIRNSLEAQPSLPIYFACFLSHYLLGEASRQMKTKAGGPRVAVISDRLWRQRFGSDPGVLNRTLTLNNQNCTVIGVMPPTFEYPKGAEIWVPLKNNSDPKLLSERGRTGCGSLGGSNLVRHWKMLALN
jgi:hypothetical protein